MYGVTASLKRRHESAYLDQLPMDEPLPVSLLTSFAQRDGTPMVLIINVGRAAAAVAALTR
jgi:hypothetical protein